MKNVLQKISIASIGLLTPVFAFAAVNTSGILDVLKQIHEIISLTIPVLIALGVLGFMWGIVLYLFKGDKAEGRSFMLWGIIALFVMTSVWGLVGILRGTLFGTGNDTVKTVGVPQIK